MALCEDRTMASREQGTSGRGSRSSLPVISLFSGLGGLDTAVERVAEPPLTQDGTPGPFRVAVATDYDDLALATFKSNMPGVPVITGDIRSLSASELLDRGGLIPGEAALVIGGPPCTPFSKSGFWIEEKRESRDPNGSLLDDFVRVVAAARPAAFVLENVQGLTYRTHASQFHRLLSGLESAGYRLAWQVLNAAQYGVPQLRRRVFVVGRRDGTPFRFPAPTHAGWSEREFLGDVSLKSFVTAKEALSDLLPGTPEPGEVVDGTFGELAAEVPPGQNYLWHTDRGGGRPVFKWRSRYWTFLLRLTPDRPATTIQAQPGPWVGPFHWENVSSPAGPRARRLRVPELLALQTFPSTFVVPLPEKVKDRVAVQRQIGNAVPVELGKAVVRSLAEQMGWLAPT
jgi:DNA (cytosine-5)-methyltransferase 1